MKMGMLLRLQPDITTACPCNPLAANTEVTLHVLSETENSICDNHHAGKAGLSYRHTALQVALPYPESTMGEQFNKSQDAESVHMLSLPQM